MEPAGLAAEFLERARSQGLALPGSLETFGLLADLWWPPTGCSMDEVLAYSGHEPAFLLRHGGSWVAFQRMPAGEIRYAAGAAGARARLGTCASVDDAVQRARACLGEARP